MARKSLTAAALCAAATLSACSFSTDSLWPSLTGDSPKSAAPTQTVRGQAFKIPASAGEMMRQPTLGPAGAPPVLGSTNFVPPVITPGQQTGTFVGQKVGMLRGELQRMRGEIGQENTGLQKIRGETAGHSQAYHGAIAAINSRLQVGTTPGNPFLVSNWNTAQSGLGNIDADITKMNSLANSVAGTSTMSAYLLETTRAAYGLSGAVEEDHRQLAILEDEVNRTVVLIDRLLNELSEDINRQTSYVAAERSNLTALSLAIKNGEALGGSLSNRAYATAAPLASTGRLGSSSDLGAAGGRPLVVIRFDRANVEYEQALYTAVSRALQRRPQAGFDLIAVTSGKGTPAQVTINGNKAKRNAEKVLRSLSGMGLPLDRVRLSATTQNTAESNEVHLYVR
jgi:hypothetical protein